MALTDRPSTRTSVDLPDDTGPSRWLGARMTLEEFLALPEEKPYLEYDNGVVTQKMAPQADHSLLAKQFLRVLIRVGEDNELGLAFVEARFVTPGWAPVPDVSYYRKERLHPRSRNSVGDFHDPPDIAVEVVSPSQSLGEQIKKCLRYAEYGVAVSLVVDPADRSVYAVRPGQPLRVLREQDRIDLDDVLPGVELTVDGLFDSVLPGWVFPSSQSEDPGNRDESGGATA